MTPFQGLGGVVEVLGFVPGCDVRGGSRKELGLSRTRHLRREWPDGNRPLGAIGSMPIKVSFEYFEGSILKGSGDKKTGIKILENKAFGFAEGRLRGAFIWYVFRGKPTLDETTLLDAEVESSVISLASRPR